MSEAGSSDAAASGRDSAFVGDFVLVRRGGSPACWPLYRVTGTKSQHVYAGVEIRADVIAGGIAVGATDATALADAEVFAVGALAPLLALRAALTRAAEQHDVTLFAIVERAHRALEDRAVALESLRPTHRMEARS